MTKLLIRGSHILTPRGIIQGDMLLDGGKIERIDSTIKPPSGCREIDASGLISIPGIIDPHVHIELEAYGSASSDDFYSGSAAGAAGGVTSYIDFAIPFEGENMVDALKRKSASAAGRSLTDYSFHAQINSWDKNKPFEMDEVIEAGIGSFKIFMPATEGWGLDDLGLYEALKHSVASDSLILVHAENGDIVEGMRKSFEKNDRVAIKDYPKSRPSFAETEAVLRAAYLARKASAPLYVCHLSSGESAEELKRLRRAGENIFIETCPQYLILDDSLYSEKEGYLYVCAPPIRSKESTYGLWRGIIESTIDTIGTDHCPFMRKEKKAGGNSFIKTPMGLPGIGLSFPLMYTEGVVNRKLDLKGLVKLLSENPARIFGLYPEKGALLEGSDADIVIFDPDGTYEITSASPKAGNCDWSAYEGYEAEVSIEYTISRGRVVFENGKIHKQEEPGRLIPRTGSTYSI